MSHDTINQPNYETRLAALGLALPPPAAALGAYAPFTRTGNLLFLAGTLPIENGKVAFTGKIDSSAERIEYGRTAARLCALNVLANIKAALGTLDAVAHIVSVTGFVNGVDDFADSPKVLNGASELFAEVFGELGKHSRAAVSVNGLPLRASVEIAVIAEVK
ncbi:MAG: RidA family protein [Puniceicoccales bacterium]|jgi:enamine deaminase RidA (YjgF/YER057c/UK114 family)|nr:RidA family protein [Puniceicoccales bacterium]